MDKSVGQYMQEASAIKQLIKEQKYVQDGYIPSGKSTAKSILMYFLFMLVGICIIQLPWFLVEWVLGLVAEIASNYTPLFSFLIGGFLIICFYSISGFLMSEIVDIGTKKSKNRSITMFSLFCFFGVIGAIGLRIILSEYFDLRMDNILKVKSLSYTVVVIGFAVTTIVTLIIAPKYIKDKPFCEECKVYMKKTSVLYTQDSIPTILPYLENLNGNDTSIDINDKKISSESIPNSKIDKYTCPTCNNGYIKMFWKYYTDKNNFKTEQIYSNCLNSKDFDKLNAI
jgi:hypothetical protein